MLLFIKDLCFWGENPQMWGTILHANLGKFINLLIIKNLSNHSGGWLGSCNVTGGVQHDKWQLRLHGWSAINWLLFVALMHF